MKYIQYYGSLIQNYHLFVCFSVTYPLDVVRRRMQMKGISGDLFAYTSTGHAFSMIVQVEGIKGLYKGMWPNLLKVMAMVYRSIMKVIVTIIIVIVIMM